MERKIFLWQMRFRQNLQIKNVDLRQRIRQVLKLHKNDTIILLNNFGEKAVYQITDLSKISLTLIAKELRTKKPKRDIEAFLAFTKKQTLEEMVKISAILGAQKIYFFRSDRSQYELTQISSRWFKIIGQALEITEWQKTPEIEIADLNENIDTESYVLDQNGEIIKPENLPAKIKLFLGPEGGWSEQEKEIFRERKAKLISLGNVNLKSEFALTVFLSLANFPIK